MIWYLLYPFRGTTEPPVLSQGHPIRVALYRHGVSAGRHWLAYILLSVTIAVLVCYPVAFLYENPASGFPKLPYHVWTSARPYRGNQSAAVDVEIRQLWVYGSYMQALQQDVLVNALDLQDYLIASGDGREALEVARDADDCQLRHGDHPMRGIHSPLMYWNCSLDTIRQDRDLLKTINEQAIRRSYLNLTLRPSSVLAGKSFEEKRVVAADALVITLFERSQPISPTWEERLKGLQSKHSDRWAFYQSGDDVPSNRLYKFQYKPISIRDDIFLFIAYSMMFLYVVATLRKTRAVKSQLGLITAVITEMLVSVFASFTICGSFGIDLAVIPQEVYPFVVFVIGLEHMFRLINAVLAYPPQMTPTLRIANALGDVGHLSIASSGQNLLFLWVLQKVVSPGVQSFCTFAAVALIFDFFFHLMFFVAVLNADVRRMELQDSIDRTKLHSNFKQRSKVQRTYWFDAFVQGKAPVITRIAGSAVSICFVLFLNVHFSDSDSVGRMFLRFLVSPFVRSNNSRLDASSASMFTSSPINSPRTPQSWLRLQNYQSAREVIDYVKPQAHLLLARIYEPLVVVFRGADRTQIPLQESPLMLLREVAQTYVYPLLLVLIFVVAIVTLLMQYLLWNEIPPDENGEMPSVKLNIKRIPAAHSLDIFRVLTNSRGHILALDLDRGVVVYLFDEMQQVYKPKLIRDAAGNSVFMSKPVVSMDKSSKWVAIWDAAGLLYIWNVHDMAIVSSITVKTEPILLKFASDGFEDPQLLVLESNGILRRFELRDGAELDAVQISQTNLRHAIAPRVNGVQHLIAISTNGEIHIRSISLNGKNTMPSSSQSSAQLDTQRLLHETDPRLISIMKSDKARSIIYCSPLSLMIVQRLRVLDLIHFDTGLLIHREELPWEHVPVSNVRLVHTTAHACHLCHLPTVTSLSIAYTTSDAQSCIVKSFVRTDGAETNPKSRAMICLRSASNDIEAGTCKGLAAAANQTTVINDVGKWDATRLQTFVGIRRKRRVNDDSCEDLTNVRMDKAHSTSITPRSKTPLSLTFAGSSRRSRQGESGKKEDAVTWETWALDSITGTMTVEELSSAPESGGGYPGLDLLVAEPGSVTSLGKRSVVVAMGASLRTITVGSERVELDESEFVHAAKRLSSGSSISSAPIESRRRIRGAKT